MHTAFIVCAKTAEARRPLWDVLKIGSKNSKTICMYMEDGLGDPPSLVSPPARTSPLAELFTEGLVEAFPDIPLDARPHSPMQMQPSPDGSMYWFAGRTGVISKVGETTK